MKMGIIILVLLKKEKNKEKELNIDLMEQYYMKEILLKIIMKDKENITMKMGLIILVDGKMVKGMEMV